MNEEEFESFLRRWSLVDQLGLARRYQCTVDGHAEFRGEVLPAGTEESILAWIKARYKVIGEVSVSNADPWTRYINLTRIVDPSHWYYETEVKRYLVEVEGVEKLFKLVPFPSGLLPWYKDGPGAIDGGLARTPILNDSESEDVQGVPVGQSCF